MPAPSLYIPISKILLWRPPNNIGPTGKDCAQPGEASLMGQARSASTMFMRAALTAGRSPPTKPITREKKKPERTIPGVRAKAKASSENVWKFIVEMVTNCMKDARISRQGRR